MVRNFIAAIVVVAYFFCSISSGLSNTNPTFSSNAGNAKAIVAPTDSTLEIINITSNSATVYGLLVDDGGGVISANGICWGTIQLPVASGNHIVSGTGYGSFVANLTGLTPGTTYFVRAYSVNSAGTSYGNQLSFSTLSISAPSFTTLNAYNITQNTAIVGGSVTNDGGDPVIARGICWSLSANPTSADSHILNGAGLGSFSCNITGLTANTTYFVKTYVINSSGTTYGNQISFSTMAIMLPTVTTTAVSSVTYTSASTGGYITNEGGAAVTARGVCWSTSTSPVFSGSHTTNYTGSGSYLSLISGLTANTTYYVRAYATNSAGTSYGNEIIFTTQSGTTPVVSTTAVSGISQFIATGGGNVTNGGGTTVTARGICWSTSINPIASNSHTTNGTGAGSFISSLSGLAQNTTYYVRAYATNSFGTTYGNQVSFLTTPVTVPIVSATIIQNIFQYSASAVGNIINDGGDPVTARGVCWNTNQNPVMTDSHTTNGPGFGNFMASLTGLTANTTYYVRTFATNSTGTAYSVETSFTTLPVLTPTVITVGFSNIAQYTARCLVNITADGGSTVTGRGVCWSTNTNPVITDAHTSNGPGVGSFMCNLTGLAANTIYYARAYATNSVGTSYGTQMTFTTLPLSLPSVEITAVSVITHYSGVGGGNIIDDGGSSITSRGVCWSTSQNPVITNTHTSDGIGSGFFHSNLNGLAANTTYYVRSYAVNSIGTAYSTQISFTTLAYSTPTVTTLSISGISQNHATGGGTVVSDGGSAVTARGVCWSTNQSPVSTNSHTTDGSGLSSFQSSISGLTANTTYYVRAYATNNTGTSYGSEVSFTTTLITVPNVNTNAISGIAQTTATGGGHVISDGGTPVTARGICWSTSASPTVANSHTTDGVSTGSFLSYITGLTPNTNYFVRSYAINNTGTYYGNEVSFTTLSINAPTVNTIAISGISQYAATGGGHVTSDGGSAVTAEGICWSTSQDPTLSNNFTVNGSGVGSFLSSLTGLTANTTYYVKAYATNGTGTYYGNQVVFSTSIITAPIVSTFNVWGVLQYSASGSGNVIDDGGVPVTSRGICWNTTPNPIISDSHTTNGTGMGTFASNITGLQANTTYYVRAYAQNSIGLTYANEVVFTTLPVNLADISTVSVSGISYYHATGIGNITYDGGTPVTERGVCWSTTQNPTITNAHTTNGPGTGSFMSSLTGLNANTLYYLRAYATNIIGTAYGNEITFTSLQLSVPTVTTLTPTNTTQNSSLCGGNVTNDGGTNIISRGICWNQNVNPTISDSHTSENPGTGSFASNVSGLLPSTAYYVRAYASNTNGIAYGASVLITTTPAAFPSVNTDAIFNVSQNAASGGGTVVVDGGSIITARGICWGTSSLPVVTGLHTSNGTGLGSFLSNITGLTANTTYYVRAYATNSNGITYGNELSFTTFPASIIVLNTTALSSLTQTSVTSGGFIISDGGMPVTSRGICLSTTTNPVATGNHTSNGSGTGSFLSAITGLVPNTTYYIRSYAVNSNGTFYGNELNFTTPQVGTANITTIPVYSITQFTGTSGGNVITTGGSAIIDRGICWSTSQSPTINGSHVSNGLGISNYTSELTGLAANTLYYVRAYVTNTSGTYYGNEVHFTTSSLSGPIVNTGVVSAIMQFSATCTGNVLNENGSAVLTRGICWSSSLNPVNTGSHIANGAGIGSFTANLTGLTANTTYHVRAYATNSSGTSYGGDSTFVTLAISTPNVNTTSVIQITQTTATGVVHIINDGGTAVTGRGICWSTTQNPTISNSHTTNGIGIGTFSGSMAGVNANTTYYVRSYATNNVGTAYGNQLNFTTTSIVAPVLSTNQVTSISQNTALSGGNITNNGGSLIIARGVCWSTLQNPDITGNHTSNGTGTGSYNSNATGLAPGTTYYLRAYATNSFGTSYGNQINFATSQYVNPTLTTLAISSVMQTTAMTGGNITNDGGYAISDRGVCWSINQNPTFTNSHTSNGSGLGSFMSSVNGLTANTTYYLRAYVTNNMGTYYGNEQVFTTSAITLPVIATNAVTSITQMGAVSGGNVSNDGGSAIITRGVCWNTTQNPVAADAHLANGNGTGSFSSYVMGLVTGTTYYIRAYATNAIGTAYGAQLTFTTVAVKNAGIDVMDLATDELIGKHKKQGAENGEQTAITMFPNPAHNVVTIEGGSLNKTIEFYNITGKLQNIYHTQFPNYEIDISNLPEGVYIVRITDYKGATVKKLIKQ